MTEEIFTGDIDIEQALDLLKRAVATQGQSFIYTPFQGAGCFYQKLDVDDADSDQDPRLITGCLVGVALRFAGIDLSGVQASVLSAWEVREGPKGWTDRVTWNAARVLQAAQEVQDSGAAWSHALNEAHLLAAELTNSV